MIEIVAVVAGGVLLLKWFVNREEFVPPLTRRNAGHSLETEMHNTQALIRGYYSKYGVRVILCDEVIVLIGRFVTAALLRFFRIIQKY
jgi:hypothetical protein